MAAGAGGVKSQFSSRMHLVDAPTTMYTEAAHRSRTSGQHTQEAHRGSTQEAHRKHKHKQQ